MIPEVRSRSEQLLLRPLAGCVLWGGVVMAAFVSPAHAYVDPNAAGPFYQLLFPVIVAVMSMLAGLRRAIVRLWKRVTSARNPDMTGTRYSRERIGGERF